MKRLLVLATLALGGCETATEISARNQIDAACLAGNLNACAAVERRVAARDQALATSLSGN